MVLRKRAMSDDEGRQMTTKRKKGILHRFFFDSHVGYYFAWRTTRAAVRALYSTFDKRNVIHCFLHDYLRIIIHSIKSRLQRQPTFAPTYCSGNYHLIQIKTMGLFVFTIRKSPYNFVWGGRVYTPLQNWGKSHVSKCDSVIARYYAQKNGERPTSDTWPGMTTHRDT